MKLQEIVDMWKVDSKVDSSELGIELERTYQLHGKYIDMLTRERLALRSFEYELKRERKTAFEEYIQGPPKDSSRKPPSVGRVLVRDVQYYIDADPKLQEIGAQVDIGKAKVEALESMVNMIVYRNNSINARIEWTKYTGGA